MTDPKPVPPAQKKLMAQHMSELEDLALQRKDLEVFYKDTLAQLLVLQLKNNVDAVEGSNFVANVIRPMRQTILPKKVAKLLSYEEYVTVATPTLAALGGVLTEEQVARVTTTEPGEPFLKLSKLGPREV